MTLSIRRSFVPRTRQKLHALTSLADITNRATSAWLKVSKLHVAIIVTMIVTERSLFMLLLTTGSRPSFTKNDAINGRQCRTETVKSNAA